MNTPGLFEELANKGYKIRQQIASERAQKYGDSWRTCKWTVFKSVSHIVLEPKSAMAVALSTLVDQKIERLRGGFKLDHLIDAGNYIDALIGIMTDYETKGQEEAKAQAPQGTKITAFGIDPDKIRAGLNEIAKIS